MSAGAGIGVAHFRRIWFKRTETFLHTALSQEDGTRPLLVGYERAHEAAFPVRAPVLTLYRPGTWQAGWRGFRARRGWLDYDEGYHDRRTLRALAAHGVQVLHAHFGNIGCRVLPVQARTGLPLVTSFYGYDVSRLPERAEWRERYHELFQRGERFLVEGPCMRRRLLELGCPAEKVSIHPIGIDLPRYTFRPRRPRAPGERVRILFCASLTEKKGARYALEAVARARAEHPELELVVAGDGPERAALETALDRLDMRDYTRMLGFLPHPRLLEELAKADLFVQPSVTARDGDSEGGAPTTLLEAQACGLPVLATHHADIPFVVEPGGSALLCPERDPEALAANLLALLKQPESWEAMGRAGREHVERFHDAADRASERAGLYAELADLAHP